MLESARFYEAKAEDLGQDFLAADERATHRVRDFPQAGNPVQARIRRRLVTPIIGFIARIARIAVDNRLGQLVAFGVKG